MLTYLKILSFLAFAFVQFAFLLPYTFSADTWYEFGFGLFVLLVVDPAVCYSVYKRVNSQWSPE